MAVKKTPVSMCVHYKSQTVVNLMYKDLTLLINMCSHGKYAR